MADSTKGGHRRIATELFLKYRPLKRPYSVIEALLSIDMDDYRGRLRSVREYSRIFGHSRDWCSARLQQYFSHQDDLKIREKDPSNSHKSATDQPAVGHSSATTLILNQEQDPEEEKESDAGASGDAPHDPPQDHSRWLNLLTPPRGEKATDAFQRERTVWLEAEMTGIEANAEAMARTKGADWDDKRTRNSWVKTRLVAFWKQYLAGDRKYRDALRREKADATEARFRAEQKARPIKDDGTEAAVQRFLGVG